MISFIYFSLDYIFGWAGKVFTRPFAKASRTQNLFQILYEAKIHLSTIKWQTFII